MPLSKLASDPGPSRQGPDCTVCQALVALPPAKAKILQAALENPRWRYSEIAEHVSSDPDIPDWIREIAGGTYGKHVRGQCRARKRLRK